MTLIVINKPENLDKLISALEMEATHKGGPFFFDMEVFVEPTSPRLGCTTAACIAGTAATMCVEDHPYSDDKGHVDVNVCDLASQEIIKLANEYLGIEGDDIALAYSLLYVPTKDVAGVSIYEIDRHHAIRMLRRLKETGRVDWSFHPRYRVPEELS